MVMKKILLGSLLSAAALFAIKSHAYYYAPPPPQAQVRIEHYHYPHYPHYRDHYYHPRVIRHWTEQRRYERPYFWVPVPWFRP